MVALDQYYFEPNMLQIPFNDRIEDSEVENSLEKKIIDFADLVKDAKKIAGFSLAINFELDWMMSHKHSRVVKTV